MVAARALASRLARSVVRPPGTVPRFSFTGAIVLVAGGSRGLGLALAEEVGRRGGTVIVCARDAGEVERAVAHLAALGIRATGELCDVGRQEEASRVVGSAIERYGRIDVLIADAGTIAVGPFAEMENADFEREVGINFGGPLHLMLAVLPHMRARRSGRIVNVGSIGGRIGVPHLASYSAGKFALTGLCEAVRPELLRDGIVLTLVQPGLMRTGSPRNALFKGRHRAEYAWFSIADALLGMRTEKAAANILDAAERGVAETGIGLLSKLALLALRISPVAVRTANAIADSLLPRPGGIRHQTARGFESESPLAPSIATLPNQRAEERFGQRT